MLAVVLGLAGGASWGTSDFLGGLASRRARALTVVALSQAVGLVLAGAVLLALRPDVPPAHQIALGALAGISGAGGLVAFYRALAVGSMSLVAPIGALGALVPLTVDVAAGRSPGPVALAGMAIALSGAALAARAPGPASRRGLGLALVAAVGFGTFFVLLAEAATDSALWALASARAGSVPLALLAVAVVGAGARPAPRTIGLIAGAGVLDSTANLLFAAGTREGLVSVVAVLGSLYPVVTIALARAFLAERLSRGQAAGAALAITGAVMIAAG